jgi:DNA replication ATP-dependent helicase Dna2
MDSFFCRLVQNKGINQELNLGEIVVKNNREKIFTVFLDDMWKDAIDYLWLDSKFYLHGYIKDEEKKALVLNKKGFLVLEPDILVSPSDIKNAQKCIREYYINKRLSNKPKSYPLLRGSLVNNAFDILIEDKEKTKSDKDIVEQVLNEKLIDLSLCPEIPEPDSIRNEISTHLRNLKVWKSHQRFAESKEITTESTFVSRKYGISGRTDILVDPGENSVTYELKTSKGIYTDKDIFQVASYQLILESALNCKNSESYIIYSGANGNNLLKKSNIDYTVRRDVINARNKIISIDYYLKTEENNKKIPLAGIANNIYKNACEKCFSKNDCFSICKTLNEKSCLSCNVSNICGATNEIKEQSDIDYYHKHFKFVEMERDISRTNFARIFNDIDSIKTEGKIIENLSFMYSNQKEITFTSEHIIESEIKPGDIVLIYSESINRNEVFKGTITKIEQYELTVQIKKIMPDKVFQDKKWTVYPDTTETSFNAMNSGMYSLLSPQKEKLRDLIQGRLKPKFSNFKELKLSDSLNSKQKSAINKAISANDYFLIQGPPGTGKTHTLAQLIIQMINQGKRVLLSAFTHRSIDNVLLKLIEEGFTNFIRVGSHEAVDEDLHSYLVQEKISDFTINDSLKIRQFIESVPLIACSSISAVSNTVISHLRFDVSVVDEAGQLTEAGSIAVISKSDKFILVGDHKQLPPVIQNEEAKKSGLSKSLFERLIDINLENRDDVLVTLEEQYRMNTNIMEYSSKNFYDFRLKANQNIADQKLFFRESIINSKYFDILNPDNNMVFIDFKGLCNFKVNYEQAKKVIDIINEFTKYGILSEKIGVITPFRAQVAEIRRNLFALHSEQLNKVTVDTVDRFQGSDRDIIIFSSVISNDKSLSDFFTDYRRINVSVTRAKKKFIVIGSKEVLYKSKLFYELIKLSKETKLP